MEKFLDILIIILGLIGGVTSAIGFSPQIYDNFKKKKTPSVSIILILNAFLCCSSWMIYAVIKRDPFLSLSNFIACIFLLLILYQRKIYKN